MLQSSIISFLILGEIYAKHCTQHDSLGEKLEPAQCMTSGTDLHCDLHAILCYNCSFK